MSAERTDHRGSKHVRFQMAASGSANIVPYTAPDPTPTTPSNSNPRGFLSDTESEESDTLATFFNQKGYWGTSGAAKASSSRKHKTKKSTMAEPRARAARHKGQMNFSSELRLFLLAYGDPSPAPGFSTEPLPETVRVLDEIVTDFILELCHGAAQVAHHARRQKIKVDDFRFALRRDPNKLGRVQELLRMERELKEARKAFDQNDDQVAKDANKKGAAPAADDEEGNEALAGGKKSKGKGKRAAGRRGSDATEESVPKKRKTAA